MHYSKEFLLSDGHACSKEQWDDILRNTDYVRSAFSNVVFYEYKHNGTRFGFEHHGKYYLINK